MKPVFVPNSPETDLRRASELISRALNGKSVRLEEFAEFRIENLPPNLFFLMELVREDFRGNGSASRDRVLAAANGFGGALIPILDWVIPIAKDAATADTGPAGRIVVLENMVPRSVNDLLLDSTPTPVSIIERILIAGTLLLIAGAPKVGKTWLAILLALCIVTGKPFLGFAVPVRRRVLYLGGEGSDATLRKRFQTALAFVSGVDESDLDNLLILSTKGRVKYDTPAGQDAITRWAEAVDVVIIDPAFRFQSRGDENSHADARAVQDFIDALKAAGRTVVVVHHTRKTGPVDAGIGEIRGAGWGEFADSALILQRKKTESTDRFLLRFDLRHDEPVDDMELAKEGPMAIVADVGKRLSTTDDVVGVLVDAGGRVEGRTAMIEALARRTGCSPTSSTPKEAILKAERDGSIGRTTLPGNKKNIYFLKEVPE